jgi:MinD-like ATPase involved in chromosome partitioning or flagellar assembly
VDAPVLCQLSADVGLAAVTPIVIEAIAEGGPAAETWLRDPSYAHPASSPAADPGRGRIVAVWGPAGAPGRTTVAIGVADEAARLGISTLLADADTYGGTVAQHLGVVDETGGLALACRDGAAGKLDTVRLAQRSRQLRPRLRVLTGLARADRWQDLRPAGLRAVLAECRRLCALTVVDCGFCLEHDEQLVDAATQRNGATLAVLATADTVLCVGTADPIGLHRLTRGLDELRAVLPGVAPLIVANRVTGAAESGQPRREIAAALQRWGGVEVSAHLPADPATLDATVRAGTTLAEIAPASALRRALAELARTLTGATEPPPTRRRRLFMRR